MVVAGCGVARGLYRGVRGGAFGRHQVCTFGCAGGVRGAGGFRGVGGVFSGGSVAPAH